MKEAIFNNVFFGVVITIAGYAAGAALKKRFKLAVFNPILISAVIVIAVLLIFGVDYDTYNTGAKYISYFLTPATVCLAIPLYQQLHLLKQHGKAIIIGILSGVLSSLGSVLAIAYIFGLSHQQYVTLLPKSITSAIGIGVSQELGGIPAITVAVIVLTGVFGNMFAEWLCKLFKIKEPIAAGIAIGTSSHAIGTSKALELGEIQGAMSSLSIVVAGLLTVAAASLFALIM
jgi:predicted murein hydrolase (TIGR00659 family)